MVEPVSILGYSLVAFFAVQCPLAFLAFWRRRKTFPIAGRAPNLVVLFCGVTLPLLLSTPIALTQDDFPTRSHLRCVLYLGLQAAALIYSLFVVLARVVLLLFHFRTTDDLRRLEAQRAHPVTGPSAAAAALAGSFFTRRHYIASPAFFRKALLVITVLQVASILSTSLSATHLAHLAVSFSLRLRSWAWLCRSWAAAASATRTAPLWPSSMSASR